MQLLFAGHFVVHVRCKMMILSRKPSSAPKRAKHTTTKASAGASSSPVPYRQSARRRKEVSYADMEHVDSPRHKTRGYDFVDEGRREGQRVKLPLLRPVRLPWTGICLMPKLLSLVWGPWPQMMQWRNRTAHSTLLRLCWNLP